MPFSRVHLSSAQKLSPPNLVTHCLLGETTRLHLFSEQFALFRLERSLFSFRVPHWETGNSYRTGWREADEQLLAINRIEKAIGYSFTLITRTATIETQSIRAATSEPRE